MTDTPDAPTHRAIADAILWLAAHYQEQPSLEQAAAVAGMSAGHFQRRFSAWVGISPKRFLQHLTLRHAKRLLEQSHSLLDTALDAGLSGTGRLHELFVSCEAMTPGEFKAGAELLELRWGVHDSPFGPVLLAVTPRGLCWLGFVTRDVPAAFAELARQWPCARLVEDAGASAEAARRAFDPAAAPGRPLPLMLRGTAFQLKVWQALLRIPPGGLASYGQIAAAIGQPSAGRAVGHAVGTNPVAVLIPCHRVILGSGALHNYYSGPVRKRALLAWEAARAQPAAEEEDSTTD